MSTDVKPEAMSLPDKTQSAPAVPLHKRPAVMLASTLVLAAVVIFAVLYNSHNGGDVQVGIVDHHPAILADPRPGAQSPSEAANDFAKPAMPTNSCTATWSGKTDDMTVMAHQAIAAITELAHTRNLDCWNELTPMRIQPGSNDAQMLFSPGSSIWAIAGEVVNVSLNSFDGSPEATIRHANGTTDIWALGFARPGGPGSDWIYVRADRLGTA